MIIQEEKAEIIDDIKEKEKNSKSIDNLKEKDNKIINDNKEKEIDFKIIDDNKEKEKNFNIIDDNIENENNFSIIDDLNEIDNIKNEEESKKEEEEEKEKEKQASDVIKKVEKEINANEKNVDSIPQKKEKINIFSIILILLLILIILFVIAFIGFTIYNLKHSNEISKGITIYGIDVSGLKKYDAREKITQTFNELTLTNINLISEDFEAYINPSEIELAFDLNSAVNQAFAIGKTGNVFTDNFTILDTWIHKTDITPTYTVNDENLIASLNNMSKDLPKAVVESSYYIEDKTLVITKGENGYIINTEDTSEKIKDSIKTFSYLEKPVELTLTPASPKEINLEKIHEEVYKEPTDANYTTNPFSITPSTNGVDFKVSIEEAQEILAESEKDCEIPLKTLYPKITTNMIGTEAFPDLIASYSTKYDRSNTNRVTNLKIAASKIDGTVLLPGETFSYNTVVGKRTIAAGYKEAGIYANGQETTGLAGGICQISTTLFNAALYANMDIIEVHNHQFVPQYSSAGRDATVVYGNKDLQFKNTRNYAIKIDSSVSGGVASFRIFGLKEENEYDIKVNASITSKSSSSLRSTTTRTLYQNGNKVSSERIYSCTYKVH